MAPVAADAAEHTDGTTHRPVILVVEDDASQRAVLTSLLSRTYEVVAVADARDALAEAELRQPDLVLVDLGLPDLDGLELCRHLLVRHRSALIVVTADATEERMVTALDLGALDYIVKPFSAEVLGARVRRALRSAAEASMIVRSDVIRCGDVLIDTGARQVFVDGREADLQARHFNVLVLLATNEGLVVTHKAMAAAMHGVDAHEASSNALRMVINKIRQQLGTGPRRPTIVTEPKIGYRLVAPSDG